MPRRAVSPTRPRRPLLVTADETLLDDLLRLAAAADTEVELAPDPTSARGRYTAVPLVVVGADQAPACLRARLPRRPDVVIVGRPDDTGSAWECAESLGASHVATLPAAEQWLMDRLAAGSRSPCTPGRVVVVLGGRGGAGASVFAASLALTAADSDRRVLLVDADPLGGGLDLVLGWEELDGPRWPELTRASGRLDPGALVGALPGRGDLALLSFDRRDLPVVPAEAMAAVVDAGRRVRDLVVVDLPRQFDTAAVVALQAADRGLVVVPAEVRAATAALKVVATAAAHCAELGLVVRGPAPGRITAEEIARTLELPLVGALRPEAGLPTALEHGRPPAGNGRGPLAVLCRRLVTELCASAPAVAA